jgi:SRSO17 transposase
VAAVKPDTSIRREESASALMDYTGRGPRPHTLRYQDAPVSVKDLAVQSRDAFTVATWRHGTRTGPGNPDAGMSCRFAALRVRPANRNMPRDGDGALPVEWLIIEWPEDAAEPTDYWLSTLPGTTPLTEIVRMAKIRWRIGHEYRELKHGLGLDHFEGRTWLGWHHHANLVPAGHLVVTTVRLAAGTKAPAGSLSFYQVLRELQAAVIRILGRCS